MTPARNVIDQAVALLQARAGLDLERAKLAVYYAVMTWKMPHLPVFPILRFCGPPGTGKSSAMQILKFWCYKPKQISGKRITPAALLEASRYRGWLN